MATATENPRAAGSEAQALAAIRSAALRLGVAPEELSARAYRSLERGTPLPPVGVIRGVFGSWSRARERAVATSERPS